MHVIFDNLKKQQKGLSNFVDLIIDYYFASYYPKIANEIVLWKIARSHPINKNTGLKVVGSVMANGVIFISYIQQRVLLRFNDSPVIK